MPNNYAGNTNTVTGNIKTTAIFSRDNKHRYLLSERWDESLPKAAILMISAGKADTVRMDTTTMLCVSIAYDNGFGAIDIVNLFSTIQADLPTSDKVNDATIVRCCDEADKIIIAFGKGKMHLERKLEVLKMLESYKKKFCCIADSKDRTLYHPLAPQVRSKWVLVPFEFKDSVPAIDQ